jgi:predicted transcriptional regulator
VRLTLPSSDLTLEVIEVHFTPELQAKLDRVAAENNSGADEYVQQLVERYLEDDASFRAAVRKGMEQADRGEFIEEEEMDARVARMFQS